MKAQIDGGIGATADNPLFASDSDDYVIIGGVRYVVKRKVVDLAHTGTRDVLTAVAAMMFRVVGVSIQVGAVATQIQLTTETSGTAASPTWTLAANQHLHLGKSAAGYGGTDTVNKKLQAVIGAGSNLGCVFHYVEMATGA